MLVSAGLNKEDALSSLSSICCIHVTRITFNVSHQNSRYETRVILQPRVENVRKITGRKWANGRWRTDKLQTEEDTNRLETTLVTDALTKPLAVRYKYIQIKIKLRSIKSSKHINEESDGPYRGFGYSSLFSDPLDSATRSQSELQ